MPHALDHTVPVSDDGQLPLLFRRQIAGYLKLFAGSKVRVRLGKPKRTSKANSYMWGVAYKLITQASRDAGYDLTDADWHRHFKRKYLPRLPDVDINGVAVLREPSTKNLDSTEFFDYVENVRLDPLVLQMGVIIPDPDPSYRSYRIAEPHQL